MIELPSILKWDMDLQSPADDSKKIGENEQLSQAGANFHPQAEQVQEEEEEEEETIDHHDDMKITNDRGEMRRNNGNYRKERYLYKGSAVHPVEEYIFDPKSLVINNATDTHDTEILARTSTPSFILDVTWPRIIQFYLPESELCQDFKPKFINLARQIRRRASKMVVEFHTISCEIFTEVCDEYGIKGVPHVVLFPYGQAADPIVLQRTSTNDLEINLVAEELGIDLLPSSGDSSKYSFPGAANEIDIQHSEKYNQALEMGRIISKLETNHRNHYDEPDEFVNGARSFVFALEHIMGDVAIDQKKKIKSLKPDQVDIFHEWIDLLHWSLPSKWKLHHLINDIRQNLEDDIKSGTKSKIENNPKDFLDPILQSHSQVIPYYEWTEQCSHGKYGTGYACGLWNLLHILSVGVAEQHSSVLIKGGEHSSSSSEITPGKINLLVKEYLQEFFFDTCIECKEYYLSMYESCGFQHCERMPLEITSAANNHETQEKGIVIKANKQNRKTEWRELALWLWEVHNDVNVRVLQDECRRDGRLATKDELIDILWPSRNDCENCWKDGGSWDSDEVYQYLRNIYWPRGVQNPRLVVLNKWRHLSSENRQNGRAFDRTHGQKGFYFMLFICAILFSYNLLHIHSGKKKKKITSKKSKKKYTTKTYSKSRPTQRNPLQTLSSKFIRFSSLYVRNTRIHHLLKEVISIVSRNLRLCIIRIESILVGSISKENSILFRKSKIKTAKNMKINTESQRSLNRKTKMATFHTTLSRQEKPSTNRRRIQVIHTNNSHQMPQV